MVFVVCQSLWGQSPSYGTYDRITVLERFLEAVYPDLRQQEGRLTIQTQEFHSGGGVPMMQIDFVPCHPGSGVPQGGKWIIPPCQGLAPSNPSSFLSIETWFRSAKFPIVHYSANGEIIAKEYQLLNREAMNHPERSWEDQLAALKRATPKFAEENREELLKTIPAKSIQEFSGCQLDLNSAVYGRGSLGWYVRGKKQSGKSNPRQCSATFEPFHGNLLSLDAL
jgi:hypothetical protein